MRKKMIFLTALILLVPALVLGATLLITNHPLNPNDPGTYFITGNALYKQGDYLNAIQSFEKAVSLNPLYEEARNNLAFLYNKIGGYDKAAAQLAELIKINSNNPSYHYDLAINLMLNIKQTKQGTIEEIEKAISEFRIADQLSPDYLNSKANIEFLENMKQEYEKKLQG